MSRGFASTYRIVLLATGFFGCFAGIGVRLYCLHVVDREQLLATIARVRHQQIEVNARRGDILDRNGAYLATSRSLVELRVDPHALIETDKEKAKWPKLAALIGMPEAQLVKIFTTKYRLPAPTAPATAASAATAPAGLVFNLDRPTARPAPAAGPTAAENDTEGGDDLELTPDAQGRRAIRFAMLREEVSEATYAEIEKLNLRGIIGRRGYRRAYPNHELAAHLIGYVNRDERPAAGIEAYADFYLRGHNGWWVGEQDGRRRALAQFGLRDVPRADGYSVKLTIDTTVQDVVEQELAALAQKYSPAKASIVVSDPHTGFILALANYPTFDLNAYNKVPKAEEARMKNVAVTDVYEPGSVFKIVAASAALEERLVSPNSTFDCSIDRIEFKGRVRGLPREDHNFGRLTVAEIVAHSSNRGAAQLAMAVGEERFVGYARAFGFGQKLGFPVGGEVGGTVLTPGTKNWDNLTITRMPMGQSIDCTVLQMHQAMSVIASGGVLLRPQIIREILDASNETVYRYDRAEIGRVISERTAQTMAGLLQAVASKEGTAPEAAIPGYDVAGKTGTAQKYIDGKPSDKHHVASFVGFFPATHPQVVISVIVDDADARAPGGVAYGSKVAAPVFKSIGQRLIPVLDIKSNHAAARFNTLAALEGGRR